MVQSWVLQCYLVVDANANLFDESKMSPNHKKRQIPCLAWTDWELFKLQFRLYSNKVTFNGSAVINMVFLSVTKYTGWRQRRVALQLWVYLSNLLGLKKKKTPKANNDRQHEKLLQEQVFLWKMSSGILFDGGGEIKTDKVLSLKKKKKISHNTSRNSNMAQQWQQQSFGVAAPLGRYHGIKLLNTERLCFLWSLNTLRMTASSATNYWWHLLNTVTPNTAVGAAPGLLCHSWRQILPDVEQNTASAVQWSRC